MNTVQLAQARARASALASAVPASNLPSQISDILGHRLVAYIAGITSTRTIREWSSGASPIPPETLEKLRFAYEVCRLMDDIEPPRVLQAWWQGLNPMLEDVSPATMLRYDEKGTAEEQVMRAAWDFWLNG